MRCRLAVLVVAVSAGLAGCAANRAPTLLQPESQAIGPAAITRALRYARVGSDQPLRIDGLTQNEHFSAHLLQIRTRRARHIHAVHDVTLMVHRGRGEVTVDGRKRAVRPGDVFHVPRGTPHDCSNAGSVPLVLVAIFTPPLRTADTIAVPVGRRSHPRAEFE